MKEKTFTYTARSNESPDKTATFTLQNGTVSVQLGNAILEQINSGNESNQPEEGINVVDWAKPIAAGAVQKILQPLPLNDFDANLDDKTFYTTAWLRTGGLRLAPITITWDEVDNPVAARAFIKEVNERKKALSPSTKMPSILDYWASWIIAGLSGLVFTAVLWQFLKRFFSDDGTVQPA